MSLFSHVGVYQATIYHLNAAGDHVGERGRHFELARLPVRGSPHEEDMTASRQSYEPCRAARGRPEGHHEVDRPRKSSPATGSKGIVAGLRTGSRLESLSKDQQEENSGSRRCRTSAWPHVSQKRSPRPMLRKRTSTYTAKRPAHSTSAALKGSESPRLPTTSRLHDSGRLE